jgi:hypothetical protein
VPFELADEKRIPVGRSFRGGGLNGANLAMYCVGKTRHGGKGVDTDRDNRLEACPFRRVRPAIVQHYRYARWSMHVGTKEKRIGARAEEASCPRCSIRWGLVP